MLLRAGCPPHAPKCLPRARAPRRPRRSALACPPCPRAGRVFPSAQPIDSDQCRKVPPPSSLPSLATGAAQQRRFVLPSCCFPRALLSTSSPQSASGARSLERAGPPQVLAERAPSVRGARSFTPEPYIHTDGLSLPLSHAIGAKLMLGIAYEHDASFAARCSLEHRDDSVIGPGLAMPSPRAACHGKGRALVSRTTSLLASRRRRSGTCSQQPPADADHSLQYPRAPRAEHAALSSAAPCAAVTALPTARRCCPASRSQQHVLRARGSSPRAAVCSPRLELRSPRDTSARDCLAQSQPWRSEEAQTTVESP